MTSLIRINFNDTLVHDPDAQWAMYFATGTQPFGSSAAVVVHDINNIPLNGFTNTSTSGSNDNDLEFTFDYDNNSQNGRVPGTDTDVVLVACGINVAKYVSLFATIKNQPVNNFVLAANVELSYGQ